MRYLKVLDHHGNRIPTMALGPYEAAGFGRRLSTWGTSSAGPNSALFSSLSTLRARSRELTRNNPIADGAIDSFVSNLIGTVQVSVKRRRISHRIRPGIIIKVYIKLFQVSRQFFNFFRPVA